MTTPVGPGGRKEPEQPPRPIPKELKELKDHVTHSVRETFGSQKLHEIDHLVHSGALHLNTERSIKQQPSESTESLIAQRNLGSE